MSLLQILAKGFRKVSSAMERPRTWLEVRQSPLQLRGHLGYPERLIHRQFRDLLDDPGQVVYDIGACGGTYSSFFAKVANVSEVISFEPIPTAYQELCRKTREHPHVRCFNVALGERAGSASFHWNEFTAASSLLELSDLHKTLFPYAQRVRPITVAVARLDDFVRHHHLPRPSLVKIDVQGFEDRVVAGGAETLRQANYCVMEMSCVPLYRDAASFDDLYDRMRSLGFRLAGVVGGTVVSSGRSVQIDAVFANDRLAGLPAPSTAGLGTEPTS